MPRISTALWAVFLLAGCLNAKTETYIAGDSLCVGLASVSGIRSSARVGAPTREVASQLRQIPQGATVIVCSGTNDAPARNTGLQAAVDAVLREAKARRQKLIWIGPINSSLWWDGYSDQADTLLALKNKSYVSLRAIGWKAGERAGDRIHLTSKGYARLWAIVKEKLK